MRTREPGASLSPRSGDPQVPTRQAVAFVDATADVLERMQNTPAGQYQNVLLLDSRAHAHAEIKRLRPRLVVVCTTFERLESFQLLTMLKVDRATSDIPCVTLAVNDDAEEHTDAGRNFGVTASSYLRAS
jgi:PleD family two-component response regulator